VTSVVEPGRRCLGDRYELHQLIAAGGMGQVWRALDIALHRPVAVKILRSEYTGDPTFVARFRAEAQHAASLSHPNIAAVFDYGEEIAQDGTGETLAYLVMELVEGEPLSALVAREGPLDATTTLSLLRQTAFGLGEAHRAGMVHRDVKPGNILVRPDGGVKITDFGIAHSARSVALTRTGQVIGTPQYLSPEQAEGLLATPASDVYALGLIGYECLTGRPAFDGDNPVTIALKQVREHPEPLPDELPVGVRELIGRSLAKDPEARFSDGAAFVAAVDDVLSGRPVPAAPPTVAVGAVASSGPSGSATRLTRSPARPPAPRPRRRIAMVLLPLLGLLAGAGIAVALVQALSDGRPSSTANAAETREAGSIVLDAGDYIGRPVDEVAQRLAGLGLNVQPRPAVREDAAPDRVVDIDPAGRPLSPGDTVVVTYAVPADEDGGGGDGGPAVTAAAVDGERAPADGSVAPSTAATTTDATPSDSTPTTPTTLPGSSSSTTSETTESETTKPTETGTTSETSSSATSSAPTKSTSTSTTTTRTER
jgi:serine/threonine-protein kinase